MANVGKWSVWYDGLKEPWPYGETTSYEIGAAWLAECALTEDWGCGAGWLSTVMPPERYRGIDGTASPRCAEVVDLVEYRSTVPGLFMRHILEHNYEWARILDNALASFTERMALILFTPEQETTEEIAFRSDVRVTASPCISAPRISSERPLEYWSAVSKKLMPASRQARYSAPEARSSASPP